MFCCNLGGATEEAVVEVVTVGAHPHHTTAVGVATHDHAQDRDHTHLVSLILLRIPHKISGIDINTSQR